MDDPIWLAAVLVLVINSACPIPSQVKPIGDSPGSTSTDVDLRNRTGRSVPLTLFYNNDDAAENCAAVLAGDFSSLVAKQFKDATLCSQFDDGAVELLAPIDISPPQAGFPLECKSVAVRAPGMPDTVLIWPTRTARSTKLAQEHLYLDTSDSGPVINGTDYVQSFQPTFPLPAPTCDAGS